MVVYEEGGGLGDVLLKVMHEVHSQMASFAASVEDWVCQGVSETGSIHDVQVLTKLQWVVRV